MRLRLTTTRRLMVLVAVVAVGLHGTAQVGYHLPVGFGLRAGACRNESKGRYLDGDGRPMGWVYQAGLWYDNGAGDMRLGVLSRDWTLTMVLSLIRHKIVL